MTFAASAQAIESRFATNWASRTPVRYDNVEYNPTPGTTWADLQIQDTNVFIAGITGTNNMHRSLGLISINIHSPIGEGTRTARGHADTAAAIFRDQIFSSVVCKSASITRVGPVGEWFVHNVTIPFHHDDFF